MAFRCLGDIVRANARDQPTAVALVLGARRVSWAELYDRACRVAGGLAAAGVAPHDRVAFLDKNGIEHFEVFFGAALLNAVCVDVNWRLGPEEVRFVVDDAQAKVLIVGRDLEHVVAGIEGRLAPTATTLVIDCDDLHRDYDSWVRGFDPTDPQARSGSTDVAFQLYSSGTTGHPKGVMLSNANFAALLATVLDMWEFRADMVNLVAMPLFHIGGGGWAIAAMVVGATCVIVRDLVPADLVRLIPEERITHAFLVPAVLQFMLSTPGSKHTDYSRLEVIVYGASPISESVLAQSVETFGAKFWQAYGLTETCGTVVNLPPADHDPHGPNRHRLRSCGVVGPGVELRLVDPETATDVAQGDVGEIWVRTPQVMKGYWNNDEATKEAVDAAGWFRSGDAGFLDVHGYLYIHDRVKDMIVSGGENVYPAEVENALMAHPDVADVAVIGVPDDRWGETPKAIVVAAPGSSLSASVIIDHARSRLATFKCPTSVEFVDALPRNPSGKIMKKDLREPYWAEHSRRVG